MTFLTRTTVSLLDRRLEVRHAHQHAHHVLYTDLTTSGWRKISKRTARSLLLSLLEATTKMSSIPFARRSTFSIPPYRRPRQINSPPFTFEETKETMSGILSEESGIFNISMQNICYASSPISDGNYQYMATLTLL